MQHITSAWHRHHPQGEVGIRNVRVIRASGDRLDAPLRGELDLTGDRLMQRLKAIEQATKDGHWQVAQHLELCDDLGAFPPRCCLVGACDCVLLGVGFVVLLFALVVARGVPCLVSSPSSGGSPVPPPGALLGAAPSVALHYCCLVSVTGSALPPRSTGLSSFHLVSVAM